MLTIHKASAGSGKTFSLTRQYIILLLGVNAHSDAGKLYLNHPLYLPSGSRIKNRHRSILAITFTNKATDEMKSRIINELVKLSSPVAHDVSPYRDDLLKMFNCEPEHLTQAASMALHEILLDYGFFNVSTIDSFFQTVVRVFARELDRQGDYELNIDPDTAIQSAVSNMLDAFNIDPANPKMKPVGEWIRTFITERTASGDDFNIFRENSAPRKDIAGAINELFNERFLLYSKDVLDFFADGKKFNTFYKALLKARDDLKAGIFDKTRPLLSRLDSFSDALQKNAATLLGTLQSGNMLNARQLAGKTFMKLCDISTCAKALFLSARVKDVPDELIASACSVFNHIADGQILINAYSAVIDNLNTSRVLCIAVDFLNQFRHDNNIMLLADTNQLLHRIIGNGNDLPFIYEQLGVTLTNFLIDEFQDTSKLQWQNLKPLVAQTLSHNYDNLIIGDEKQAIYRFRNSDSSMLRYSVANEDFPNNHVIKGNIPEENTNWRSAPDIVKFNNSLFPVLAHDLGVDSYSNVIQSIPAKNSHIKGYIHFFPYSVKTKKGSTDTATASPIVTTARPAGADVSPVSTDVGSVSADVSTSTVSVGVSPAVTCNPYGSDNMDHDDILIAQILRQHDAGYRWNQIAVLVDKNKLASQIVDLLISKNIPVISDEGLLLSHSSAVRTIISMMTLVNKAHIAEAGMPRFPQKSASVADMRMILCRFEFFYRNNGGDAPAALESALNAADIAGSGPTGSDVPAHTPTLDLLITNITRQNPATLASLVEIIIASHVSPQVLAAESSFIAAFQDYVAQYARLYGNNLRQFLRWWSSKAASLAVPSPPGIDAVAVMTVHKSKGLEFDCVHIPRLDWNPDGHDEQQWVETPDFPALAGIELPKAVRVKLSTALSSPKSPFHRDFISNLNDKRTDSLNKTYVAFTRAARELCVYYKRKTSKTDSGSNMAKIIEDTFAGIKTFPEPLPAEYTLNLTDFYDADSGQLIIGAPTVPEAANTTSKDSLADTITSPESPDGTNAHSESPDGAESGNISGDLTIDTSRLFFRNMPGGQLRQLLSVDSISNDDIYDPDDISDNPVLLPESDEDFMPPTSSGASDINALEAAEAARNRGNALHFALSNIFTGIDANLENALHTAACRYHLTPETRRNYLAHIRAALRHPDVAAHTRRWFEDLEFVRNEAVILLPPENPLDAYDTGTDMRPDRIMFFPDSSIEVLDYKFTSRCSDAHRAQVLTYARLLKEIYPDRRVTASLWYIDLNKVITFPPV